MKTVLSLLSTSFIEAVYTTYPQLRLTDYSFVGDVCQSKQALFGQYQCNTPLRLSKLLGLQPRILAQELVNNLSLSLEGEEAIEKVEIAGPGFINIFLSTHYLAKRLTGMMHNDHYGIDLPDKKERIIIDFSSPNTAKEMHVGHLRSTIIGDSLARLFEFLGHDVLRLNHIGDWGTSFGMLIAYLKDVCPQVVTGNKETDLSTLVTWYKAAKKRFDEEPDFKKASQQEVVLLQSGDAQALRAWEIICAISRVAYNQIYELLDIKIIERGESFYNQLLPAIVADLATKNLITLSQGAKCVFLDGYTTREGTPLPLMVQKSDGGYNYDTTDLAAIKHRIEIEEATRIIYVTDAGQSLHFCLVFDAARKAGYLDDTKTKVDHVGFGMVLGPDGKKFKTRSGETEKLVDLLEQAVSKARATIAEKNPTIHDTEAATLAHRLGIGAVKYADLSTNRTGDYVFSYDKMLMFEGNTAIFLLYTYVRAQSIKRRSAKSDTEIKSSAFYLEHQSEQALAVHLMQFHEALDATAKDLMPNKLTDYLYQLAEKFNAFFRDCRVEGSEYQASRLALCFLFSSVMKQGLEILGIQTVEKM